MICLGGFCNGENQVSLVWHLRVNGDLSSNTIIPYSDRAFCGLLPGSARVFGYTLHRGFLNRVYGILQLKYGCSVYHFLWVFLLITQYEMPFITKSETTKRSKDRKINGKCAITTCRRSRVWPVYFIYPHCDNCFDRAPFNIVRDVPALDQLQGA